MESFIENTASTNLELNDASKDYILEIAKWSRLLSIVGFVGLGIMALSMIMMAFSTMVAAAFTQSMGYQMGIVPVIILYSSMIILYFFPIYYLFKSSQKLKAGISNSNSEEITEGFENLKSHYRFIGIITLIILSIYALIFLSAILIGAFGS
jgi:ABC-type multidrug transport system fused ATPase/permease subunit